MQLEKNVKLLIATLVAIIAILVGFILYGFLTGWLAAQQQAVYELGRQHGATEIILTIIQLSRNCQPVPLTAGNQTFNFIDTACLQAAG